MSKKTTTRPRGFAAWNPTAGCLALIEKVLAVLAEYGAYLPLTVRQIFYRLVGAHGYEKTEAAYERLGEEIARARRAGIIDFGAIRDDGSDWRALLLEERRPVWSGPSSDGRKIHARPSGREVLIEVY